MRFKRLLVTLIAALCLMPSVAYAASWDRLYGKDAYETMGEIVRADGVFTSETVDTVIVATGDGYWDALAASGLAGTLNAPVLITPTNSLASQTRSEIQRLAPSKVFVMGGPAAISDGVVNEIQNMGVAVERAYGPTAPDTAVKIYEKGSGWSRTAIVATSNGYWDALSIAPFAYAAPAPIFLTQGDNTLGQSAVSVIRANFDNVIIVGGPAAVSSAVESQLSGLGITRLAGPDALDTSAAIASWEIGQDMGGGGLFMATSNGYWDALTGAGLAGAEKGLIVLCDVDEGTKAFDTVDAKLSYSRGRVLGGPAAISDANYAYFRGERTETPTAAPSTPSNSGNPNTSAPSGNVRTNEPREYVLNTKSKKFHFPSCGSAANMSASNRSDVVATRDELIARGYSPCGNCEP